MRVMSPLRNLVIASVAVISFSAGASSLSLIGGEIDAKSRTARTKVASELLADLERLASLVQSPRPSESAWVESERAQIAKIKDSDALTGRFIQLMNTAEFQQSAVYAHLQEVKNALLCITQSPATLQREMLCWSVASLLLDESDVFDFGVNVLVKAKRLPEDLHQKLGTGATDGIQFRNRMLARGIQRYIMLPYLRGEVTR